MTLNEQNPPTHYTTEEGGQWLTWSERSSVEPVVPNRGRLIHAIRFLSGEVWDAGGGWRPGVYTPITRTVTIMEKIA